MSIYIVPGSVLGSEDIEGNKKDNSLFPYGLYILLAL